MENNTIIKNEGEENPMVKLHLTKEEKIEYYKGLRNQLIKLLYLIEDERKGQGSAELYFYGFIFELKSANILCGNELTKVCVKMFGLFNDDAYKSMTHEDIKRQIFECKGTIDHLIKQLSQKESY